MYCTPSTRSFRARDTVTLSKYGAVQEIQNEVWSRRYRYQVPTGVCIVSMALKTHVPSKTIVAGHRVMVAYEGQPLTCFKCNESGHYHQEFPRRRNVAEPRLKTGATSWAEIVAQEERNVPHISITMDVTEQWTVQHTEIEGRKRQRSDYGIREWQWTERGGAANGQRTRRISHEKGAREQQGRTDSTQSKQKREITERIEERPSSNDGSRHKLTRTTKEPAPGASTETEERDSGDDSEEEGTWFSLSTIEKIGEEVDRVQPTTLKKTRTALPVPVKVTN